MNLEERIDQLEKQKKLLQDSIRKFQTNRPLDTMDEVAYRELQVENRKLKKRAQEAEGELTIIKGIGSNSPEMKALQARVNELEGRLGSAQDINDEHQRYNSKLQTRLTEVEEDNKKLSYQIEDKVSQLRKSGL
jgi:DNA repair exonuclease SbcCD ATPase subunit